MTKIYDKKDYFDFNIDNYPSKQSKTSKLQIMFVFRSR